MKLGAGGVVLALFAMLGSPHAPAQTYKCVDERGATHYTETPRPGCKGRELDLRPAAPHGTPSAPARDLARDNADFKRRQIERERLEEKEKAQLAALQRQCVRDRDALGRLETASRVVDGVTPAGEKTYMDDRTRERHITELRAKLAACR